MSQEKDVSRFGFADINIADTIGAANDRMAARDASVDSGCIALPARPLAISAEEHATRAWLDALVAAGWTLELLDRTRLTVDQAVEHMLEAGRKHTGHTVCLAKNGSGYLNLNGWLGWL